MGSKECSASTGGIRCTRAVTHTATVTCGKCPTGNRRRLCTYCKSHMSSVVKGGVVCSVCKSRIRIVGEYSEINTSVQQKRIGDKERRDVTERLSAACGDGQLTLEEFEERLSKLADCKFGTDIEALVSDLPAMTIAMLTTPVHASPAHIYILRDSTVILCAAILIVTLLVVALI